MLRRWRSRRLQRQDNSLWIEHIRTESDPKQNIQLRQSYDQHPLRLAAVIVSDIFIDSEILSLWSALRGPLGPNRSGDQDASRVRDFLRRSPSRTLGGAALGPIQFHRADGSRTGFGSHALTLPDGIERVSLVLFQFAPGMVMAATVAELEPSLADDVFHQSHASPITHERDGGISQRFVETAKATDLANRFQTVARAGLLPRGAGFLRDRRYPSGTVVVWLGSQPVDDDGRSWNDVGQVLGIETWHWWESSNWRLYTGVPEPERKSQSGGVGYSILDMRNKPSDDDVKEFGGAESVRHELTLGLYDWLPLLLLVEAAQLTTDTAGRLRERLNRGIAASKVRRRWPMFRLGSLVSDLHDCEYRLERLKQAAGLDDQRAFRQFPVLVYKSAHIPDTQMTQSRLLERLERLARKEPPLDEPLKHLRNAAIEWLDRLTKSGLHDVRLSLDRARLLAQLRSGTAQLLWTVLVGILTAALVFRELTR